MVEKSSSHQGIQEGERGREKERGRERETERKRERERESLH
jgi:hypothetical protein